VADPFAVHLGGGAYLDSSGHITFGAPSGAQIYQAPGGFKLDTKKIQDAAKDLSGLLPTSDDDKKKWMQWGVSKDIVDFLAKIAGAAGIIATAIAVYAWAIGVLITVMDVVTADGGISPELGKALVGLKNQMQGGDQIDRANHMIDMHSQFDGRIDRIQGLLTQLAIEAPTGTARAQIFASMQTILDELAVPLSKLRDQEWATTYDPDSYTGRAFASGLLVFEGAAGLQPVPLQAPNVTVFDYRLGVPMLLYAATVFTSLAQIAMPWFRSAGMYAGQLRKTADAIDRFVLRMQEECLTRTNYTAQTVLDQDIWSVFEVPSGGGPRDFGSNPKGSYAVGGFDLVGYSDAFLVQRFVDDMQRGLSTGTRGLFNYHWTPPAPSLLLEQIASEANDQSKADYANLQIASGMLRLISTAAWLRYLTTPPTRSQTVTGSALDARRQVDETATTATSPKIPFLLPDGVVKHAATLKRYEARVRALTKTQPPGYVPDFKYKIILRTINSALGNEGWRHLQYVGEVWQADYIPAAGDPRCKRLKTDVQQGLILSEVVLYEGQSPAAPLMIPLTPAHVRAATFDWYVPVATPWSRYGGTATRVVAAAQAASAKSGQESVGTGGVSIHLMDAHPVLSAPMHVMSNPSPLGKRLLSEAIDFDSVLGVLDVSLDKAERRHVRVEDVDVDWQLTWADGSLDVRVFGRSAQRPFQFYVVVEEVVYSGETGPDAIVDVTASAQLQERIHTPMVAEMVNQVVLVPEEFFVEERKAIEQAAKILDQFEHKWAVAQRPQPGDPVELVQRSINHMMTVSPSTSTLVATLDKRVEFAAEFAPQIWNEVLREAGHGIPT
jgi:hypothetical protein